MAAAYRRSRSFRKLVKCFGSFSSQSTWSCLYWPPKTWVRGIDDLSGVGSLGLILLREGRSMGKQLWMLIGTLLLSALAGCGTDLQGASRSLGDVPMDKAFDVSKHVIWQYYSVETEDREKGKIICRPEFMQDRADRFLGPTPARDVATLRLTRRGQEVIANVQVQARAADDYLPARRETATPTAAFPTTCPPTTPPRARTSPGTSCSTITSARTPSSTTSSAPSKTSPPRNPRPRRRSCRAPHRVPQNRLDIESRQASRKPSQISLRGTRRSSRNIAGETCHATL